MSKKPSFFTNIALAFAFSASILACSDSDDAEPNGAGGGGDAGSDAAFDSDAAVECVLQGDGTCPEGCISLKGTPLDAENHCWLDHETLDCVDHESSARSDEVGCYVNVESGTLYRTPTLVFMSGNDEYRECDGEERELMFGTEGVCKEGSNIDCKLLEDGSCPEGCEPQKGHAYDDENACLLDEETLSCAATDGFDSAIGCYVHEETGTKFWTPNLYYEGMDAFRTCTEDEKPEGFDTATPCE